MRASRRQRVRAGAYTLVTTAIVLLFALAEWAAERYVSDRSRVASTALEVTIVFAAALVFRPIHQRVEAAIESLFSKRKRQALGALTKFRRELTSFKDVAQLLRRVIEAIEHHLEAPACAVYLRRDGFTAEACSFDVPAENVAFHDALAVRLRSSGMPAQPRLLESVALGTHAFPMTVAGDLVGFLTVDCKDGDLESDETQMLCGLAEELGLALVALDPLLRAKEAGATNNIPADLPPIIGRERECTEIEDLLQQSRLVTLTGAGGVGKTRMALHVAAQTRTNADGVWFIDLAPINDAALVEGTIGAVFGIVDEGGKRPVVERIAAALREKHLLIVLDNCEHLTSRVAETVALLLQSCPRVKILATSRERLGLKVELPYRMPSLSVPSDGDTLSAQEAVNYEAIELFVARARAANIAFRVTDDNAPIVADIVRRVDGIAMAIELAASRIRVMSLSEINQRLNERFKLLTGGARTELPRHQTLHALIGWSYDLLDEKERMVLRRVSVFRGDWSLEAAHAVCASEHIDQWNMIDVLTALVDKSLMNARTDGETQRYRLLESTRQFAAQRLAEAGEQQEASMQHCRYFASRARRFGDLYWSTDSDAWTAAVREDLENFRAAVAWGLSEGGDADEAAAIVADLRWFWYAIARREGHDLLNGAESSLSESTPVLTRGLLYLAAAVLDTSAKAAQSASEAASRLCDLDPAAYAEALAFEAIALGRAGHINDSSALFSKAIAAARDTKAPRLIGWVLSMAAYWRGAAGDDTEAAVLFEEAATTLRFCGDPWQLARLQLHRAEFHFAQCEHALALSCVRDAESVFRARKYETGLCIAVLNACAYLLAMGRLSDAWEFAREGLDLARRLDNEMAFAWAIGHLAEVAADAGNVSLAARLLGHADAIYAKTGGAREPTEQHGYDRALEIIRAELPAERITILMSDGANLNYEMVVYEAKTIERPQSEIASTA